MERSDRIDASEPECVEGQWGVRMDRQIDGGGRVCGALQGSRSSQRAVPSSE